MDILIVGGGGREHAIAKKLAESPLCGKLYAAPGNGGIAELADCVPIPATDLEALAAFAGEKKVDYVVVAPDDPLVLGLVDLLAARGIPAFGPSKAAARLEGSKAFSKSFMRRHGIPTAAYEIFEDADQAVAYLEGLETFPVVVKADGLALGKGVIIAEDLAEAKEAVLSMMRDRRFGESGSRVVIEEFLTGPEATVLAFTDGETVVPMVSSMDHKRALDGNLGLNTGGMGAIAPNPHYHEAIAQQCMRAIFLPTIRAMQADGAAFKGCIYFGLMLTPQGPKVIEYNCRFGDPEAQAVLALLESDLLEIMLACTNGGLTADMVRFSGGAAACVVMASGGYPGEYGTGFPISGLAGAGAVRDTFVCHAGTKRVDGDIVTAGGRVLGVTSRAGSLPGALRLAYEAAEKISFEKAHFRRDIGKY